MEADLFANRRKVKAVTVKAPEEPAPVVINRPSDSEESKIWEKSSLELDKKLSSFGFKIVLQESDGNCLFRAVSEALTGSPDSHLLYRSKAVNLMRAKTPDFLPFVAESTAQFEQYLARVAQPNAWGGEPEIQALSLALNLNIAIFQTDNKPEIFMENFDPNSSCLCLAYHGKQHYNLVKLENGNSGEFPTLAEVKRRLSPPPPPPAPPSAPAAPPAAAAPKKKLAGLFGK